MNKDERDIRDALNPSLFETVFFVGAPPRSGNTYLRYVLKDYFAGPTGDAGKLIKHDHSSSYALDQVIGTKSRDSVFVSPIRDPYDTLKSKLVRTFYEWQSPPNLIQYATSVDDLCLYWEILLLDPSKFCLVNFNELTSDKDIITEKISKKYPKMHLYKNPSPLTKSEILELMKLDDKAKYGTNHKLFLASGHTPREESEYSNSAKELLDSPVYARRLKYLYEMYNELLELTI